VNQSPSVNSSSSNATSSSSGTASADPESATTAEPTAPRTPAELKQQGRAFRDLLAGKLTPRELADLAAKGSAKPFDPATAGPSRDEFWRLSNDVRRDDPDGAAMASIRHVIDQGPTPQAVAAASAPDLTFAELVEKHIRRALASERTSGASSGEMHIELTDAVLPGMALSLRRTTSGWQLVASGKNPQSRDTLEEFAPALVARFERAALGKLEISLDA
jgi:hypothetical protein